MKNEIKIDASELKVKKISNLKQDNLHDQFYFNENSKSINELKDQTNVINQINSSLIPPLTRIGSDKSSESSSSSTFSKRKPIGNLTPTKFEHLTNKSNQLSDELKQFNLRNQTNLDKINNQILFNQLNSTNLKSNNSLNSIQSTNLSANSSNRSSPNYLPNHRSHNLTNLFSKHNAFKQPYSSNANLFDSIQHLDIHKLILNDKRNQKSKLFSSTSTLPTCSSNSLFVPKNAK